MPDTCDRCGADQNVEHFIHTAGQWVAFCCNCYSVSEYYKPHTCAREDQRATLD